MRMLCSMLIVSKSRCVVCVQLLMDSSGANANLIDEQRNIVVVDSSARPCEVRGPGPRNPSRRESLTRARFVGLLIRFSLNERPGSTCNYTISAHMHQVEHHDRERPPSKCRVAKLEALVLKPQRTTSTESKSVNEAKACRIVTNLPSSPGS